MNTIPTLSTATRLPGSAAPQARPAEGKPAPQTGLRFGSDAFVVSQRLKAEQAKLSEQERAFKTICDRVVWQDGNDTINVAEMIAYLCRISHKDNYPGYGSIETLEGIFRGLETDLLRQSFDQLHKPNYYLGFNGKAYWLRENGIRMIERLYPSVNLPPIEERFTGGSRRW